MKILFVCTGNTCRSPMAEALLRHMLKKEGLTDVEIASRGVHAAEGQPMSEGTRAVLEAAGVPVKQSFARRLAFSDIDRADLVLVMEHRHRDMLKDLYPKAAAKVFVFKDYTGGSGDVADPLGGSLQDYEKCRIELQDGLLDLISKFKSERLR